MKTFLQKLRYELSDKQQVFAVKGPRMKTLGIVSHWQGKYSHMGWSAFRGAGLTCKFLKAFSTKSRAVRAVVKSASVLLLLCAGCLARWDKYPGAYIHGQCAPYARAVTRDLSKRNIEAYEIIYLWRTPQGEQGAHACVLYRTTDNRWAIVSNTECFPAYVKGDTLLRMVQYYDRNAVMISEWDTCPLPLEGRALTASWYEKSKRRDGKTASGQPFDPNALTAASWEFYGKRLKVTGPYGPVEVFCNDKGPARKYLKTRQLDLSRRAFELICPLEAGLVAVTVEVLP